ncbi:hypothetical protein COV15_02225 [Candidatus Woesearchaeota archaeon CG10_big_fil_rev_8_21_14_0_10_34_12]|nr:MAG: hypothetical protein COV15_02225 [Candidatus Woesearchaeota archaeon CG10_big_fil_rev_8_21_14_0_10_34_12]
MKINLKTSQEEQRRMSYSTDASQISGLALNVVIPETIDETRNAVRITESIVPRGGGTGLVGGAVPTKNTIIDISKLNKILDIDINKKIAYVEAGIILDILNNELEKHGLEFPVQPSSHSVCTIGGMIATNAAGSRAIKYGKTDSWVQEVEMINPIGELIKIPKPDVKDFAGMEGTTGLIVKARLKLIKKPARKAALYEAKSKEEVVEAVRKFKSNSKTSMIELYDSFVSKILGLEENYHLLVEFEDSEEIQEEKDYKEIMNVRDSVYPYLAEKGYMIIEDPKIFLDKFIPLAEFLEINSIPYYGHIGSGIIHPCFKPKQEKLIDAVMELVRKLHGQATGEHGIGMRKEKFLDETEKKLLRRVKERLDKNNKFNPGKLITMKKEKVEELKEEQIHEVFSNE